MMCRKIPFGDRGYIKNVNVVEKEKKKTENHWFINRTSNSVKVNSYYDYCSL